MSLIETGWQSRGLLACLLWPVSMFYALVTAIRRYAYSSDILSVNSNALPVIVVGNISVGGTGKTPLCSHLVSEFQRAGWRPAIVSRGYGGERHEQPHLVSEQDLPSQVGDEPLMLYRQTGVPVCVCVKRAQAVDFVAQNTDADIVFSDDGLQHLAMAREKQIVVIDGARGLGNGWLLPAGPLRESAAQLAHADLLAVQSAEVWHDSLTSLAMQSVQKHVARNTFTLELAELIALDDSTRMPLSELAGQSVTAMAGIGHPERFFQALRDAGLQVNGIAMPDHHVYTVADLEACEASPLLVTSKDAVKLRALGELPATVFEVSTVLQVSDELQAQIISLEHAMHAYKHKGASIHTVSR